MQASSPKSVGSHGLKRKAATQNTPLSQDELIGGLGQDAHTRKLAGLTGSEQSQGRSPPNVPKVNLVTSHRLVPCGLTREGKGILGRILQGTETKNGLTVSSSDLHSFQ